MLAKLLLCLNTVVWHLFDLKYTVCYLLICLNKSIFRFAWILKDVKCEKVNPKLSHLLIEALIRGRLIY